MGIGFVIFFWLVLFAILFVMNFILSRAANGTFLADFVKASMIFLGSLLIVASGFSILTGLIDRFCPSCVFYSSFGFYIGADVKDLAGQRFSFGDAGSTKLTFYAEKNTVQKIIYERDFSEGLKRNYQNNDESARIILEKPQSKLYTSTHFKSEFSMSQATLIYDEETGQVYFFWSGVD